MVLDIKFENLASNLVPDLKPLAAQDISSSISTLTLTDDLLILALSSSKGAALIIHQILLAARSKGHTNYSVDVPASIASVLRSNLTATSSEEGQAQISINRIEGHGASTSHPLSDRLRKFRTTIVIGQTTVDPLFGFAGSPTALLRNFLPERMGEAYSVWKGDIPNPGVEGDPIKIASEASESLGFTHSIEILEGSENMEIAGIHTGGISDSFRNSIAQLKSIRPSLELGQSKAVITSASRQAESHSTLHSSLNSLWNCIHNVKDGGSAVLVAENRNGIGGGALQMYVEGRLKQDQISGMQYVTGLEHLVFLRSLREKYELGLLSSLPRYYQSSLLGLAAYSGMKEVLEKLLQKHGKTTKCLVISEGDLNLPALAA